MLDRATIERLSRTPEKNAPTLNVALAEEGGAAVLLALARSRAVGPEALEVIAARVAKEGADVGRDDRPADEAAEPAGPELDRLLAAHPRSSGAVRDAVLARHADDAWFVLAAAAHPHATPAAIERAVDWPAASLVHDRIWLALVPAGAVSELDIEAWSQEGTLRREAAARITHDAALLEKLAGDACRAVRRAVASNRVAGDLRRSLAEGDAALEVRARAARLLAEAQKVATSQRSPSATSPDEHAEGGDERPVESARFAAGLRAMAGGGVLAPDVHRALAGGARELDEEGAVIAGEVLPQPELGPLVEEVVQGGLRSERALGLATGIALRAPDAEREHDLAEVVYDAVKALSRTAAPEERLTGKARFAAWAAEGVATSRLVDADQMIIDLARGALASDRMILARAVAARPAIVPALCAAIGARATRDAVVPPSLLELAWADAAVTDAAVIELALRLTPARRRAAEDSDEDDVDLDPSLRGHDVLERVVLAATLRATVSPRAALAAVALDARRVRYVLSAMPQWKGRVTGARLARVLRQHAGALSAARAEARAKAAGVQTWTERFMSEIELAIALAVGHVTAAEVVSRLTSGRQKLEDGLSVAFGAEARAAVEGPAGIAPLVAWVGKNRQSSAAALAVWILLERFDRTRAASLVASAVDGAAGAGVVPASVSDALALLERRSPGRLEQMHPQSPRGRAILASALARAYRNIGGTREEGKG